MNYDKDYAVILYIQGIRKPNILSYCNVRGRQIFAKRNEDVHRPI